MTLLEPSSKTTVTQPPAGSPSTSAASTDPVAHTMAVAVSPVTRHSRSWQLVIVIVAAALVALGLALSPKLLGPAAEQALESAKAAPGTFRPTPTQWAGLKFETVTTMAFRSERVTEGSIAIDDDLTTPVFCPILGGSSK